MHLLDKLLNLGILTFEYYIKNKNNIISFKHIFFIFNVLCTMGYNTFLLAFFLNSKVFLLFNLNKKILFFSSFTIEFFEI